MEEEKLFWWITVALILCLAVASFVIVTLDREKEPFSSVAFLNPDRLPEVVRVNTDHGFAYEVSSFENEQTSYELETRLELYRLFDVTEGLYSCLSPYRKRFYLGWTNESFVQYIPTQSNGIVQDMVIDPDPELLTWPQVNLYFDMDTTLERGDVLVYYKQPDQDPYFTIRINTVENQIYYNNEPVSDINLSRQNNKFRVSIDDGEIELVVNREVLFTAPVTIGSGQFGFESRNALFDIRNMIVSQFFPIEIPDRGGVINYQIENKELFDELFRLRGSVTKSYNFIRQFNVNEDEDFVPRNCNDYSCTYTQTTAQSLTIPGDNNITDFVVNLPWDGVVLPFWHIATEPVQAPWHYFNLTGDRPELSEDASISFLFDEGLGFIITNKSISLLYATDEGVRIHQYPYNETSFFMQVLNQTIVINSTLGLVSHDIPFDVYNSTMRIYTVNSAQTISTAELEKVGCEPYTFCRVRILPSAPRRIESTFEPDFGEQQTIVIPSRPTASTQDDEVVDTALIQTIPTSITSFSGSQAVVRNSTNFTFNIEAQYLDGDGLLTLRFYDLNDSELFNVSHNVRTGSIGLNDREQTETFANPLTWRRITVEYKENISIYFNNTLIDTIPSLGLVDGYFSIESVESHLELRGIRQQVDGRTRRLPLLSDPCELRLIYSEVLREESFSLEPEDSKLFTDSYELNTFFDYGRVIVEVEGSSNTNNTPLEIHHWLVRE